MADTGTVLAFDYGLKRIGVAVGQTLTGTANPLKILPARDGVPNWQDIGALLEEWQPALVLIGLPLNMDGTESDMSRRARKFSARIHGRFGAKVALVDERLSTFEARERLGQDPDKRRTQGLDAVAAVTICEDWLRNTHD